jgi:signal transduction histidine kinase
MLVFALCEAAAVFFTTMNEIEKTKERERETAVENAALEKLSRMKTEFLASVSHELKTPLTVISNNAQLARMHAEGELPGDSNAIPDAMRLITNDVERMAVLVNQLLDATRIEEGHMGYSFAASDIIALIRDSMNTFHPELSKKNNTLSLNLPNGIETVYCDRERIRQVLLNLVSNANRFTKGGGITVSAEKQQDCISISVADKGEGIPEKIMATIFDRYTTANPKKNENPPGTGLGLYISKHIIEAHSGKITAVSEPGQGTVMNFTLPVYKEDENDG